MNQLNLNDIVTFVEYNIDDFHQRRLGSLLSLKLSIVLKRKNPYLFKAKNVGDAHDLVKLLLDAHLSSQEEAIFGEFLEKLAIYICNEVYDGHKSSAEGIDLEFERDGILYIVAIKSGPNWGNSSQIKRMLDNFKKAQRILRTSNAKANIRSVNGCCYGQERQTDKGEYDKLCGQDFWEFISGDERLFIDIVEPLGYHSRERNDDFSEEYTNIINIFTHQFTEDFCLQGGRIDWEKLVAFNSGSNLKPSN